MTISEKVKLNLRIADDNTDFDSEIADLINAAEADLGIAGVTNIEDTNPLIIRAITTYCKANFGETDEYDRYKKSYDEQKSQLCMATGYTNWGDD